MDRLLFVDDEPFVLRSLRRIFELEGFEVVTAPGGREALELLRANPEFQLIGSDYRMPEMSGSEFLQRAREIAPHSRRLLISAIAEFNAAAEAVNRGEIHRIISKPWNTEELIAVVRASVEEHHLRRRYSEAIASLHEKNAALESLNRELESRVSERTAQVLDAFSSALDARGDELVHSRRAAALARILGEELKLSEPELITLEQAGLLHDIGKIGVPDAVLLKHGPLEEHEWQQVRRHPEIGHRMLARIPFLQAASQIVLQHHERWDGAGYPAGLKGEGICLSARILALAETYESMSAHRSYRPKISEAEVRAEIAASAGKQFDPEVVRAFLAVAPGRWREAAASA